MHPPSFLTTGKISFRPPWSNTEFNELTWGRVTSCHVQEIPPKNTKILFPKPKSKLTYPFRNRKLRFVQPSQTRLILLIPYRNTGTTTPESSHPRTTFSHAMRKALFAQLLPYQILPPTHKHDVCTYSKSGDAPPSFANSLWRYHHQKVCCRIIRRTILLFIIWNICNKENMFQKLPKTTWKWGGNSLMSPVSGRGLANKDICLPLRLGIRWLDGKLKKNRLII